MRISSSSLPKYSKPNQTNQPTKKKKKTASLFLFPHHHPLSLISLSVISVFWAAASVFSFLFFHYTTARKQLSNTAMASDHDTINIHSSSVQDYLNDDDDDDHPHSHHLSRLSMCNNTTTTNNNVVKHSSQLGAGDEEEEEDMGVYISRLSIEGDGSDGDADEEFSDSKEGYANKARGGGGGGLDSVLSSDSDREIGCLSLPTTPPRRRNRRGFTLNQSSSSSSIIGAKEYASENEAAPNKGNSSSTGIFRNNSKMRGNPKSRRSSFFNRERWFERANWEKKKKKMQSDDNMFEHENDQSLFMITRPRGGSRSLCMDLGEVKACRDLGFELEHERLEIPTGISISAACSTIDTSSGGNSPISSWRISSPGDDPKDVKARLKVWAQAVALVSSSPPRHSPN